jgi:hypothetical protein
MKQFLLGLFLLGVVADCSSSILISAACQSDLYSGYGPAQVKIAPNWHQIRNNVDDRNLDFVFLTGLLC